MNHRAARDGAPLVQPMYWSHPEDADAYQVPNQFAFGTELLVAPITSPKDAGTQLGSVPGLAAAGQLDRRVHRPGVRRRPAGACCTGI